MVCSIWPIDGTLSSATTPGQSEPGGNGNEGVIHIPQISKAGVLPSDGLMSYPGHIGAGGGVLPLHRDAVSVFYSLSQLGCWYQMRCTVCFRRIHIIS